MKTKLTGLAILILVIIAAVVYVFFSRKNQTAEISGYLGGEKSVCWRMRRFRIF